jgi:hypothetical protein|tara:strand:- start:2117 stop:2371 length:255 start_codon:yes stop_codon:yes gene_type:complete
MIIFVSNKRDMIDLDREMAWVTFLNDGWETKWHPVTDMMGNHLEFNNRIMDLCREKFNRESNWVTFGIAPTSQMMMKNSVKDNI